MPTIVTEAASPTWPPPTETLTSTPTPEGTEPVADALVPTAPQPNNAPPRAAEAPDGSLPAELIIGGVMIVGVLMYAAFYWRGISAGERYAAGFIVETCPVCQRGRLTVETRVERFLGVPRPRHTVRCDTCRSVLRQTGQRWWRYAVDPLENPALYERFNGREIDDTTLRMLGENPISRQPGARRTPPTFVEGEDK